MNNRACEKAARRLGCMESKAFMTENSIENAKTENAIIAAEPDVLNR